MKFRTVLAALAAVLAAVAFFIEPAAGLTLAAATVAPLDEIAHEVKRIVGQFNSKTAELDRTKAEMDQRLHEVEQRVASFHPGAAPSARAAGSELARKLHADPRIEAMRQGAPTSGRITLDGTGLAELKAIVSQALPHNSDQSTIYTGESFAGGITGWMQRRLGILDMLPRIRMIEGSTFTFARYTGKSGGADFQAEQGAGKSPAQPSFEKVTLEAATVAAICKASEQVLMDSPSFQDFLGRWLIAQLLDRIEVAVVAGDGTGGGILGLTAQATLYPDSAPTSDLPDVIGLAIADAQDAGFEPNAILLHPKTWQTFRGERDSERRYVAGTWAQPAPPTVWGVPAVLTRSMPEGGALVADLRETSIVDRMAPVVQAAHEGEGFSQNIITVRSEWRGTLAVANPAALLLIEPEAASE